MIKYRIFSYTLIIIISSIFLGTSISYYIGGNLPEKTTLISSKKFPAKKEVIWATLLDIESYPLWKPNLKKVEMLGTNDKGYTKWREYYSLGKEITFEISEYIPDRSIEVRIIESKNDSKGLWIYKLSNYEEQGILQVSYYANTSNKVERFIKRYIDVKYSEADHFLLNLEAYIVQLLEDQEEMNQFIENSNS